MDVRVVRGLGVILVIAGLATCGRGGETEMSADCARMTDLAASGTAAADTLPMPASVARVTSMTMPAEGVVIPAGESTLAMPDPDVPKTVAVGVTSRSAAELRAEFEQVMRQRGLNIRSRAEGDTFSFGYDGPAESGAVVVRDCGELTVMVTHVESPLLPPADAALPSCTDLRPSGIHRAPVVTADGTSHTRHCVYRERGTSSLGDRTVITVSRPPVGGTGWRRRLQNLRHEAREHARLACPPGTAPEEDQPYIWTCVHETAFGTSRSIATAHENDFWVGVTIEHEAAVAGDVTSSLLESVVIHVDQGR